MNDKTITSAVAGNLPRFFQPALFALLFAGMYPLPVHALGPQDLSAPDYEGELKKIKRETFGERQRRDAAERKLLDLEGKSREQEAKIRELEAKLKTQAVVPAVRPVAVAPAEVENAPRSGLAAGSVFQDTLKGGGQGPELVVIPSGRYWRGAAEGEAGAENDERPQKEVRINYRFALGRYEVTVGEYLACVSDGGCERLQWQDYQRWLHSSEHYKNLGSALTDERHPIVGVSWHDAQAYVKWLSGKSGQKYRLPSELEWEYAARGEAQGTKASQPYPWGKIASGEQANYEGTAGRDRWAYTSPVGNFPENGFKLHDMHGNVWEWVEDCFYNSYYNSANIPVLGRPEDGGAATGCSSTQDRVLRGGSWFNNPQYLRSSYRDNGGVTRNGASNYRGFRVARTFQ